MNFIKRFGKIIKADGHIMSESVVINETRYKLDLRKKQIVTTNLENYSKQICEVPEDYSLDMFRRFIKEKYQTTLSV